LSSGWQHLPVTEPDIDTKRLQIEGGLLFPLAGAGIDGKHIRTKRLQHPRTGRTRDADAGYAHRQLVPRRIMGRRGQP
jgi:hypothetical protein